jgi:hypothetical protein
MHINSTVTSLITGLLLLIQHQAHAETCRAISGAQTTPLLELYTSEGCSSCPPADKWLSSLPPNPKQYVPLAFHVDYWDYIGWHDRFSKADYSDRQRNIAAYNHASYVYTPQFVLNGKDFKGGNDERLSNSIAKLQKLPALANLSLEAITDSTGIITLNSTANLTKPQAGQQPNVFVALYENKLVSQVKAGENNGRELKHDYVVRELFGAFPIQPNESFNKSFRLSPEWKHQNAGAVIFVQDLNNGEILQSLQLAFCQ